jgi:hypothetical protein
MRKAFWTQGTGVTLTDSFHMKSSCALTGTVNVAGAQNILWTDLGASTDLSAYSTINWDLWVGAVIPTTPNRLGIAFCSDASAAVPIVTYWCQPSQGATNWIKNVIPCGTTLPNNVRSIAIVSGGALNLSTCYFDTIWLSKAPSATDYIDGHSLIGISDAVGTKYYGIDQITDDTIFIGNQANAYVSTILTSWGWYGTSGTYNLYRRDTRKFQFTTNWLDMPGYINTPGTSASRINFECGYNIATDTQDGETWIANINGATGTAVLFNGTAASNTKLNRYCSAWINTGVNLSASDNIEFRGQFVCCSTGINCTALNSSIYYHAPNCGIAITCSSTKNTLFYAYSGTEIDCANSTTTNSVYFNGSVNTNFQDDIVANGGVGTNVLSLNVTYAFKAKKYTAKWCVSQPI